MLSPDLQGVYIGARVKKKQQKPRWRNAQCQPVNWTKQWRQHVAGTTGAGAGFDESGFYACRLSIFLFRIVQQLSDREKHILEVEPL